MNTNERLSVLFDGIMAITITFLILDLKLPELQGNDTKIFLFGALAEKIPEIIIWFISFVMIARIWQEQNIICSSISGYSRLTTILTFLLLAMCSLIPFVAHLVGKFPSVPITVVIFSVLMVTNMLIISTLAACVIGSDHLQKEGCKLMNLKERLIYLTTVIPMIGAFAVWLSYKHHALIGVSLWLIEPLIVVFVQLFSISLKKDEKNT